MNINTKFMFIGSRGIGKTFLCAVFCTIKCILYPGTKICVASGTRGQATDVLLKIVQELVPLSTELKAEIDWGKATSMNGTNAILSFKNGSYIKVVTASDSARGNRGNILILDEFRLIKKQVVDTVLKKFLTQQRMPPYRELSKQERKEARAKESNQTFYLSSAYLVDTWAYAECVETYKYMGLDGQRRFICGFPYQLSVAEGIINTETIEDELLDSNFNEVTFSMEYEAIWYGNSDGSFFDYSSIAKNRKIKYPMLPDGELSKLANAGNHLVSTMRILPKQPGEKRILSADIALMSSRRFLNDATAVFINRLMPTKAQRYMSNFVYTGVYEGKRTDDQALEIRRLFDEFDCDYIVLDCSGLGLGVYDALSKDMVDPETGEIYPALSCCNNQEMAERCAVPGARKAIWAVKASAQFNSDCAYLLRDGFANGRIRLLCTEYELDEIFGDVKGYKTLSPEERVSLQMPYINTTLLVDELTKLRYEAGDGGRIKIRERSGMRKDRYSSISYNYYVAVQIGNKNQKNLSSQDIDVGRIMAVRPPKRVTTGSGVSRFGNHKPKGWR